ncbi:DUF1714-domain-containing protein, partial [Lepidopterella palustris CBS 459.81]
MHSTALNSRPLKDLLADVLPKDIDFTFYHFSTPPTKSPALYSAPPHRKPERTYCESHFLAVSVTPPVSASISSGSAEAKPSLESAPEAADELLVLAIEVLIYTTKYLTTVFVSKADSTGCISALHLPRSSSSPLKSITGCFVKWLVRERQRPGKRLVVSLFARAQDQYLFPGSVENADKHVLDDRGLIRWWCRVLDPLVREYMPEGGRSLAQRLVDAKGITTTSTATTATSAEPVAITDGEQDDQTKTTAKGYLIIP